MSINMDGSVAILQSQIKRLWSNFYDLLNTVEVYDEIAALEVETNFENVYTLLDKIKNHSQVQHEDKICSECDDIRKNYNTMVHCYEADLKKHEESGHALDYLYDY